MTNWFHRLLNPHCPDCRDKEEYNKICNSCETLSSQLAIANLEKKQLLQALLDAHKPVVSGPQPEFDYERIKPASVPWAIRKQMLEAEDRKKAELLSKAKVNLNSEVEQLEKELGVIGG